MLKVMIVEDEPVIRNGIANSIDWESLGCEVVALAENGIVALENMKTCEVNIVISDIMMPEMDGMELSDHLLNDYSGIKVILLTGYKEFMYVKQAIKMGVSNYILKPTDPDELEAAIKKVVSDINGRMKISDEMENLRCTVQDSKSHLKDKFLYDLMFRPLLNISEIAKKLEYYEINATPFWLIGIGIDSFIELESFFTEEDINILVLLAKNSFEEYIAGTDLKTTAITRDRCVYAIIEYVADFKNELNELLENIKDSIHEQGKFTVSIGVSNEYDQMDKLRMARKEVDACLEQRIFIGGNKIIYNENCFTHMENDTNIIDTKGFIKAIENGENILPEADKIKNGILASKNENQSKNASLEAIVLGVKEYCSTYGKLEDLFDPPVIPLEKIINSKTLAVTADGFYEIALKIASAMQGRINNRYLQVMDAAKKYIDENYNKDISLETVASKVYMSQWYFSKIFKILNGTNFICYIADVRINKAKVILAEHPELKNYEVAEKVGFISVRYFNELFKKIVGLTPSEFRSKSR